MLDLQTHHAYCIALTNNLLSDHSLRLLREPDLRLLRLHHRHHSRTAYFPCLLRPRHPRQRQRPYRCHQWPLPNGRPLRHTVLHLDRRQVWQAMGAVHQFSYYGHRRRAAGRRRQYLDVYCCALHNVSAAKGSASCVLCLTARNRGWGIGALVTLVPLYQSEISPPKIRGLLVGMHGVLLCVGYTLASWVSQLHVADNHCNGS